MADRISKLQLATYEWFEYKPRYFWLPLYSGLMTILGLAASWWFDDPITPGTVCGWWIIWPLVMSFFHPLRRPEPPQDKPPLMSPWV
jgi:hypothetical protein